MQDSGAAIKNFHVHVYYDPETRDVATRVRDAIAERLRACIETPEAWRALGAAGRARYEALFSERAAATAIGEILRRKLGRSPAVAEDRSLDSTPAASRA